MNKKLFLCAGVLSLAVLLKLRVQVFDAFPIGLVPALENSSPHTTD